LTAYRPFFVSYFYGRDGLALTESVPREDAALIQIRGFQFGPATLLGHSLEGRVPFQLRQCADALRRDGAFLF
jgi:hypothetical protein